MRCRVVTVSDTRTEETDPAAPSSSSFARQDHEVAGKTIVPDDPARVRGALRAGIETPDVISLSQADGYIEIPTGVDAVEAGERVDVTLF